MSLKTHYTSEVKPGEQVSLAGRITNIKDIGKLIFITLSDEKGNVQVTVKKDDSLYDSVKDLTLESSIAVEGKTPKEQRSKKMLEIHPTKIRVLSTAIQKLPLDVSGTVDSNLDTRLDWRTLDLRMPKQHAVFKIESKLVQGMEEYLYKHEYTRVFTPSLMGIASESGAEAFEMKYFKTKAYLRQDPQLHRQLTIASGFEKIFDLGPSWRAEPSHTTRHLCEHNGCAVELAYIKDEYEVMKIEEELVRNAIKKIETDCKEELELLDYNLAMPKNNFPVLEFPEVYDILEEFGKKYEFGEDYDRESEVLLCNYAKEKYGQDFIFINKFPFELKPFYVMKDGENKKLARSTDLLCKGVELSSGGQRENRYEKIIENAKSKNLKMKNISWFTEHFKYGVPPHGGFNIGIERLTKQILGIENIREANLFPRDTQRCLP